jgi:hypothetical protein
MIYVLNGEFTIRRETPLPRRRGYRYAQVPDVRREENGTMDRGGNRRVNPNILQKINRRPVSAPCRMNK